MKIIWIAGRWSLVAVNCYDMDKIDFDSIRKEFISGGLDEKDVTNNPFYLFGKWMKKAISEIDENANAMVLSTVSGEGRPSSRIVLLKDFNKKWIYLLYTLQ